MLENKLGGGKNMFDGDNDSQVWARGALPILVKIVHERKTISYKQLAQALGLYGRTHPINMRHVCANISATLHDLEERYGGKIPRITSIVIRGDKTFSKWMCERLTGYPDKQPSPEQINSEFEPIYNYSKWGEILELLNLSTPKLPVRQLLKYAARRRDTRESHLHKRLKDYVANHPESVGINKSLAPGQKEVELPSGDRVDVLFETKCYCIAVEVKACISNAADLLRGIFQCVKYREILKARRTVENESYKVDALLVIEGTLTKDLRRTKDILHVEVFENIDVDG